MQLITIPLGEIIANSSFIGSFITYIISLFLTNEQWWASILTSFSLLELSCLLYLIKYFYQYVHWTIWSISIWLNIAILLPLIWLSIWSSKFQQYETNSQISFYINIIYCLLFIELYLSRNLIYQYKWQGVFWVIGSLLFILLCILYVELSYFWTDGFHTIGCNNNGFI